MNNPLFFKKRGNIGLKSRLSRVSESSKERAKAREKSDFAAHGIKAAGLIIRLLFGTGEPSFFF